MQQEHIWNLIAKKISGEISADDLHELERLLRANPELHYSMQTIMDLWRTDQHSDHEEEHEAFDKHIARMKSLGMDFSSSNKENSDERKHKTSFKNIKGRYIWATVALSLSFFVFIITEFSNRKISENNFIKPAKLISEISTKNGSKTNLILPDGSKVWLNAGSNLTYDSSYGKNIREVTLSGEGFFDVVKNKEKPFIIHASKINIKVLGTEFNVKSYPADKTIEASLIRGSIEVTFKDKPNKKIILKPNEKIVVDNIRTDNKIIKANVADKKNHREIPEDIAVKSLTYENKTGAIIETSWVENKLIFQDESFEEIAKKLERWYGVSIKFDNEQLKENHLTGSFTNETIRQALDALKFTASFNYSIDAYNNVVIY